MHLAKRLIDEAKRCGVDAVKFQAWTPESLYARSYLRDNPSVYNELKQHSLSISKLRYLAKYADTDFVCSVFSEQEVDELEDVLELYKIASMDMNNIRLLKRIATKSKPVLLSCGMSTVDEIARAVDILAGRGRPPLTLLHCVSKYPPGYNEVNLTRMSALQKFRQNVGYSDHTTGIDICLAAVTMGAVCIEKHFTLDKKAGGWDDHISANPKEMKQLVTSARNIELALEELDELPDKEARVTMRRSIVINKDMGIGDKVTKDDIDFKRPGTGIPADKSDFVIGKRLRVAMLEGDVLNLKDVR